RARAATVLTSNRTRSHGSSTIRTIHPPNLSLPPSCRTSASDPFPLPRKMELSMAKRIMTIYGTRPEAIKVAPIIKAIEKADGLENVIVVTGQHREMLDQVNTLFGIVPDHDLNIMSAGQSLNGIVAKVISGVDQVLEDERPDVVIVQ